MEYLPLRLVKYPNDTSDPHIGNYGSIFVWGVVLLEIKFFLTDLL